MLNIVIFCVFINICLCSSQDAPTVTIPSGKIIGFYKISHGKNKYEAYESIPYALPPVGDRRFKPPEPIKVLPKELLANKYGNRCFEYDREIYPKGEYLGGSEDCLYLNIYAPIKKENKTLPVIFYIHGGAFQYGVIEKNEAHFLIDYDIVYVSINYRLGVLGFLSTEDEVVPGNMGLKDQNMALQWVHENIQYFGGDSKRITLAGLSAGGASVHYHYLSPMSAGLFQNGISLSGTALDCWTQTENSRDKAFDLAKLMGCSTNNTRLMVECLKKIPVRTLVEAQEKFMPWQLNPFTPFGPVVEKNSENPFINRSPIEIINSGDVYDAPWITGVVSEEGLYPVAEFARNDTVFKDLNDNWNTIAPYLLDYNYTLSKEKHSNIAQSIRKYYFGDKAISRENLSTLVYLVGDRIFFIDAEKAAKAQAKVNKSPVWFFYYSYRAFSSLSNKENFTENLGVCHGDDVYLVLGNEYIDPTVTEADMAMHKDLVNIWITIARKRLPEFHPHWSPVNATDTSLNYLHIVGPGNMKMENDKNFGQKLFWNTIDFNENVINSSTHC